MKPVKLITSILTLAAAITVSSFGWGTTASAADNESLRKQNSDAVKTYIVNPYDDMEKLHELKDATVTMKFKDAPKLVYAPDPEYGTNITSRYIWTSSDETVVNMKRIYALTGDEWEPYYLSLSYIALRPLEPGTAIISAVNPEDGTAISFTINVKGPKITAKQKSCNHKFKTTTKATCERPGLKTCQKCGLQKLIAEKAHKYTTVSEGRQKRIYQRIYQCGCGKEFDPDDYGSSDKSAYAAYAKHNAACKYRADNLVWRYKIVGQKKWSSRCIICKNCTGYKTNLELMATVNAPDRQIPVTELDIPEDQLKDNQYLGPFDLIRSDDESLEPTDEENLKKYYY